MKVEDFLEEDTKQTPSDFLETKQSIEDFLGEKEPSKQGVLSRAGGVVVGAFNAPGAFVRGALSEQMTPEELSDTQKRYQRQPYNAIPLPMQPSQVKGRLDRQRKASLNLESGELNRLIYFKKLREKPPENL